MVPRPALLGLALTLLTVPAVSSGQSTPDARVEEARLSWQRGDYPEALRGYLEVLRSPDGARHVREIAALTGEVFEVRELAEDGGSVRVGPASRYAAWEAEDAAGASVVRVAELGSGEVIASVEGSDPVLSGTGLLAYSTVEVTDALTAARRVAGEARAAGDRSAYFEALRTVRRLEAAARTVRLRDLESGAEEVVDLEGWVPGDAVFADGSGVLYLVAGRPAEAARNDLLRVEEGRVTVVPTGPGFKDAPVPIPGTSLLLFVAPRSRPVPAAPDAGDARAPRVGFGVVDVETGREAFVSGPTEPVVSADGSRVAWLGERDGLNTVESVPLTIDALSEHLAPPLVASPMPLANPALAPDGSWVAYQKRPVDDWEIFAVRTGGGTEGGPAELQVTWEIQHDLYPVFVDDRTVMAMKGEGRHRRAFLYALDGGTPDPVRLHHNNTVRTIAPEYEWAPAPDGSAVVVVAERDGDTVSPERGVYAVHLDRPVGIDELTGRLERALAAELDLRERGEAMFAPVADRVRRVTERADAARIYGYARVLYSFGSKYITEPGNAKAVDYLTRTLRTWGYEPELQWFEPRPGIRSANVVARLPGTTDPELVYVVSSHFDSTRRGPGADDNSSGTTALLEAARVLRDHPQPATIEFAFFTGEEAGLLGSREYVRRAVTSGKRIVGALNNDMVGWANGPRLDNTIRYSNPGIRDVQHNAAMLFSDLITYDALYYKSTDAAAYYEVYGDIVGGIGSYPVLGNPHYHQFTDRLNTIDQRLVTEVSRTTVATVMLLASSPSRVTGLELTPAGDGVRATWSPSPESDVERYVVAWVDRSGNERTAEVRGTGHTLAEVRDGSTVRVKAVNARGLGGWDWARAEARATGS